MFKLYNIIGSIGVLLILVSYLLLQLRMLSLQGKTYSVMNALGALMILYSLFFDVNIPSIIIESFWLLISIFGIYKATMAGKHEASINKEEATGK